MWIDKQEFAKKIGAFRSAIPNLIEKSKEKRLLYYRQILIKRKVEKKARLDEIRINFEQINASRKRPQDLYLENEYISGLRESQNMSQMSNESNLPQIKSSMKTKFRLSSMHMHNESLRIEKI